MASGKSNPEIDFVSRLPRNFRLENELKQKALESMVIKKYNVTIGVVKLIQ